MSNSRVMKLVTGSLEALLAIPVLGGALVMLTGYWALLIMLILHVITLVITKKDNGSSAGSILGIITSLVAWIPIVGWIMHLISAIFLIAGAVMKDKEQTA